MKRRRGTRRQAISAAMETAYNRLRAALERDIRAKERIVAAVVDGALRCAHGDGGLHGPFQFAIDTHTVTCRACGEVVDAFLWMLDIEIRSMCIGDTFTHHDIVRTPTRERL